MSEKQRPIARLKYYDKAAKQEYDVASVWPSDRFDWKRNILPEREAKGGKYPTLLLSEAAARAERGEGYLSYCVAKGAAPKGEPRQQQRQFDTYDNGVGDGPGGGGFDDDVPFAKKGEWT